ncbi:MAG: sigma-54 dependent transcriptional regulator [Nitrospinota bacterium]|nr:sigma-54 dependent transcriptional regulator [Nitrospinota bacterium]
MMDPKGRALVIDDDEDERIIMDQRITRCGFDVVTAPSGEKGLDIINARPEFDVVFLDQNLPGVSGLDTLANIMRLKVGSQVIMMTAYATVADAVSAIKKGAFDYLVKPIKQDQVDYVLERASRLIALEKENLELKRQILKNTSFGEIIHHSHVMRTILEKVSKVAAMDSTVLIVGESGTGKELMAKEIHKRSARRDSPFIAINCAALPEDLLTGALFGFERGAFTGAMKSTAGCFEEAEGGTLFLDEVGDMSPKLQSSMLRVLQEREFSKIGSYKVIKADFRLITATNRHMEEEVKNGAFREDLYYRLNVVPIHLPPLRERSEDIPLLVNHFMGKVKRRIKSEVETCDSETMKALTRHGWNGNCRELENVIENILVVKQQGSITYDDLPDYIKTTESGDQPHLEEVAALKPYNLAKTDFEKSYISRAYGECQGNITRMSELTGIQRSNLYLKLKKYELLK